MTETISLDLAKRFKEAGIEFECKNIDIYEYQVKDGKMIDGETHIKRYTAQELRERLPEGILNKNNVVPMRHELQIIKSDNTVVCSYYHHIAENITIQGQTLAEALGEMYLYLHNNNLLGPKKQ